MASTSSTGLSIDKRTFESALKRIETLKALHKNDVITEEDFAARRDQIINELTGTSNQSTGRKSSLKTSSTMVRRHTRSLGSSFVGSPLDSYNFRYSRHSLPRRHHSNNATQIKKHPPPDWNDPLYPIEKACKITYNFPKKSWDKEDVRIKLDTIPFDKGGLRLVFHMRDTSEPNISFVAKLSRDARDKNLRSLYFEDVRMQTVAAHFAKKYNSYHPPKKVEFLVACVLELKQREGSPVCGVERFISGHYRKYNNNKGWVSEDDRNTPGSFCHFSYVASDRELLICDIQGVGDVYTDPQIHSKDGQGFGKGNLGQEGMDHFLSTHRCNRICQFLRLPNLTGLPYRNEGTLPLKTLMNKMQITQLKDMANVRTPLLKDSKIHFPELRPAQEKGCPCVCFIL